MLTASSFLKIQFGINRDCWCNVQYLNCFESGSTECGFMGFPPWPDWISWFLKISLCLQITLGYNGALASLIGHRKILQFSLKKVVRQINNIAWSISVSSVKTARRSFQQNNSLRYESYFVFDILRLPLSCIATAIIFLILFESLVIENT